MEVWMGVEFRHFAALAAVAQTHSFREAADELGYVQSAVSQQLARLEELVGARLVERARGHTQVELTAAGEALLDHAESILSHLHAAQADLRGLGDGASSVLRVGVFHTKGLASTLPRALAICASRAPSLHIEVRESISDRDMFADVEAGELDVALAELPLEKGPFDFRKLTVDPLQLLVPADSPLARRTAQPSLREVAAEPLVANTSWRMFDLVEAQMRAAGGKPERSFTVSTNAAAQALVGAGLGVAVLPRLSIDLDDPTTEAIDLDGELPRRTLVEYWHRDRQPSESLAMFLDAAEEAVRSASPAVDIGEAGTAAPETDAPTDALTVSLVPAVNASLANA